MWNAYNHQNWGLMITSPNPLMAICWHNIIIVYSLVRKEGSIYKEASYNYTAQKKCSRLTIAHTSKIMYINKTKMDYQKVKNLQQ